MIIYSGITILLWLLSAEWFATSALMPDTPDQISVILFKLPRSGSSWFTELLNNVPSVFLSKEIIQRKDVGEYTMDAIEAHLASALARPVGKLSDSVLPSGRFIEDYWMHKTLKAFQKMQAVGFSINPEHCQGVHWDNVVRSPKSTKVIILERSNRIKAAISGIRGKKQKLQCGKSNLKFGDENCKLPSQERIEILSLLNETLYWQIRYDKFNTFIRQDPTISKLPQLWVNYEDLLENLDSTMERVLSFLFDKWERKSSSFWADSITQNFGWKKRTPDELSQVLENYESIYKTACAIPSVCDMFCKQLSGGKELSVTGASRFTNSSMDIERLRKCSIFVAG